MLSPGAAVAVEITVLAGMGVVSGVRDVAPAFEFASGHKVIVSFEAGPSLMHKVNASAPADLVAHYPEVIDDLIKQGKLMGSRVDFARAGVGVAVKAGARKPDIGTPEAFKRAMLAAKSIAYSRTGGSGIIAAKLMERLGIAEQLKDKTKLVDGLPVAEVDLRPGMRFPVAVIVGSASLRSWPRSTKVSKMSRCTMSVGVAFAASCRGAGPLVPSLPVKRARQMRGVQG